MPDRPDVSIIIVSYNTRELLRECLESLRGTDIPVRADAGLDKTVQATPRGTDSPVRADTSLDKTVQATPHGTDIPARAETQPRLDKTVQATREIIVIDNASADGSAQMVAECFPEVKLIANSENRGFGAACNQGLQIAEGRYALILNADIRAEVGALQRLVAFMDAHPDAIACGGQLRYPDGRIQPSCARELTLWWVFCEQSLLAKLFPRTRLFGGYWRTYWDFSSTIETEQVMGACLMLRPCSTDIPVRATDDSAGTDRNVRATQSIEGTDKNVRATGFPLFDESYFLYCEDTDLCYRIRQAGGKIYYVHDAVFVHHLGASGEPQRAAMVIYYNRGKERYFRKFHGEWQARVCRLLNKLGALLRVLIGVVGMLFTLGRSQKAKQYTKVFWEVLLRS
jgi:GT2 family glycosyltransferase